MPKVAVDITDDQAQLFEGLIASGEYTDLNQIFMVALGQWESERLLDSPDAPTSEELRALWEEGKASGTAGPIDWDKFMQDVHAQAALLKSRVA